ncbi:hypothetical protein PICST_38956 [Scheffersomyces stipitis CBS 6054]|uniref:Phosphoribulokinase/uridine kinase domain-containing protein n=1 Tax=Scheffersomyces stipitis (strain ATCC 58785 / CBS 6054 / NBRC 10063 / NRRL Y-11545) TaxID=322104 RepID=A3GGZ1_PICST|nr:predicted protein [Scheffersomyces stipitis CBS 6054]EAZ63617.2 hypothetical protein PICST_38956 [Scheffersomyces stipitis CBS 6054]KAG2735790.1 hypothetical protein G9P44_002004 [Scheffersomyces stipitis]
MTTLSISIEFLSSAIRNYDPATADKPLVIGISGPQGSGKSYLTKQLTDALKEKFPILNIVSFSSDDLYLTHEAQNKLNEIAKTDNNKLLQGRGLPGTHDLELATKVFDSLINSGADRHVVKIPSYNKAAFNGEGDRASEDKWTSVTSPANIVIFEGWFNGFRPLHIDQVRLKFLTSDPSDILQRHRLYQLESINLGLEEYAKLWDLFDKFIFIETPDINNVYKWRIEQEHELIQANGVGMNDEQVVKFVDRYMPVYRLYYKKMCTEGTVKEKDSNLSLVIDENRNVVSSRTL